MVGAPCCALRVLHVVIAVDTTSRASLVGSNRVALVSFLLFMLVACDSLIVQRRLPMSGSFVVDDPCVSSSCSFMSPCESRNQSNCLETCANSCGVRRPAVEALEYVSCM